MELFPAADEEQFEFIKRVIDDCDYYLLIIGGRYGSTTKDGISYTEQEYDYAIGRGLKVMAFLHENPDDIPRGKSEMDPALQERLQQFRDKVSTGWLVKFWKTADQLPGLVALSLANTIKTHPAVGWVRANKPAGEEVLAEVNDLRHRLDELQAVNAVLNNELAELREGLKPVISDLAGLDESITLHGTFTERDQGSTQSWKGSFTWRQLFEYVSPYLLESPTNRDVKNILEKTLFQKAGKTSWGSEPRLDDQEFQTISLQFKALGLVDIDWELFCWSLTPSGNKLMMELRTVRTKASDTKK